MGNGSAREECETYTLDKICTMPECELEDIAEFRSTAQKDGGGDA